MNSKKSQMEIMGLAIIVILVSMAFLFVVRFVIMADPAQNIVVNVDNAKLAASFLDTLTKVDAQDCSNIKFSTLFEDCSTYHNIMCNGQSSCEYIREKTQMMIDEVFTKRNINCSFVATTNLERPYDPSSHIFDSIGHDCAYCSQDPKIQPLPTIPPLYLRLSIYN
jgi:hypothetical protein